VTNIRVLLADDHATLRDALSLLINAQQDMSVVATASDGREAVQKTVDVRPDVAVLDVSMPQLNGPAAAAEIRQRAPATALVALTRHADEAYVQSLMQAGVNGYVLKQSPSTELVKAIRAAAAGNRYLDPALSRGQAGAHLARRRDMAPDRKLLSAREEQVLRRVAWGNSNKDIAAELAISIKTVEIHKANAMRRLGLEGRIDIVRFALLQGWLRESDA
jgi:two-component system response regulator NreC